MVEFILFGVFFLLLIFSVPVAFALGLGAVAAIVYTAGTFGLANVTNVLFSSIQTETLLAIPFFILAGAIMEYAGISSRLIGFADAMVGHRKTGMALVVIIAAFIFAAISGSGPATVAALGTILIPALVKRGYMVRHAAALMASAGSMGIIVPPSITLIIFGVLATEYSRVSIGRLFMGGILPGAMMAIALYIASLFVPRTLNSAQDAEAAAAEATTNSDAARAGAVMAGQQPVVATVASDPKILEADVPPSDEMTAMADLYASDAAATEQTMIGERAVGLAVKASGVERRKAALHAVPGLMVPVIILGGIYGGVFTPTESAVVAAVWALIVGFFIYRELKFGDFKRIFVASATQSATVMIIVGAASIFAYVITREQVATTVANLIFGLTTNPYLVMALVIALLLIVGALIDATSALYLFVPLLAPVLLESGFNITTIGVMMTVNLAVGLVTPPVGINLFVAAGIAKTPLFEVAKGVLPFVTAGFIVTVLTAYIPFLSNFLPDLMGIQ